MRVVLLLSLLFGFAAQAQVPGIPSPPQDIPSIPAIPSIPGLPVDPSTPIVPGSSDPSIPVPTQPADPNEAFDCDLNFVFGIQANFPCKIVPGPEGTQAFGSNRVRIYHFADADWDAQPLDHTVATIMQAAREAIDFYSRFVQVPDVDFVIFKDNLPDRRPADAWWQPVANGEYPCEVRVSPNLEHTTDSPGDVKQNIAHELFHCVQYKLRGRFVGHDLTTTENVSNWWLEGSAEYFSNLVYPSNNREYITMDQYNTDLPLVNLSYAANIFFQYLGREVYRGDVNKMLDFLVRRPAFPKNYDDELASLVKEMNIGTKFFDYALAMAQQKIVDTDGKPYPAPKMFFKAPTEFSGDPVNTRLEVKPFAIGNHVIKIHGGQLAKLQITQMPKKDFHIALHNRLTDEWTTLWTSGLKHSVDVPCGSETDFELVYTYSGSDPSVGFEVSVERDGEPYNCVCDDQGFKLDACLIGHWNLNNQDMIDQMTAMTPGSISNISFIGSGSLIVGEDAVANFNFDHLKLNFDITSGGYTYHQLADINGYTEGKFYGQKDDQLCTVAHDSHGFIQMKGAIDWQGNFGGYFGDTSLRIAYKCGVDSLKLVGSRAGKQIWSYSYRK